MYLILFWAFGRVLKDWGEIQFSENSYQFSFLFLSLYTDKISNYSSKLFLFKLGSEITKKKKMTKWEKLKYKITNAEEAQTVISSWKDNEETVVFTNGCFDILHRGHVTYLAKAASLGDYLVIGLNSDDSVKAQNKGENRPINDETSRSIVLAALEFVDLIVIFNDTTPLSLIELLKPSILVKGADYDKNETDNKSKRYIVGSKVVIESGGSVETIGLEEGFSTTRLIDKIKG